MEMSGAVVVSPEHELKEVLDRWYEELNKGRFNFRAFGRMKSVLVPYLEDKTGNYPVTVGDLLSLGHKDFEAVPRFGPAMLAIIEAFIRDAVVGSPMQLADGWPVVPEEPTLPLG